jgi:hypothetical protein
LDIDSCDVTLISVLRDDSPPMDPAGSLLVHTEHLGADLDTVRRDPERGTAVAKARPGQSIVILGGMVPHETIPVGNQGPRIISDLCFPRLLMRAPPGISRTLSRPWTSNTPRRHHAAGALHRAGLPWW